jgi:tetratricopeptide (TPR) repeat protein
MAGIVIVDSAEAMKKVKKRVPFIIAGAVAALVVAFGVYLGFTPYGFFGMRHFFPKEIKQSSPLYKRIVDGRDQLARADHASLQKALENADAVLRENDQFVDARALFAMAAFTAKAKYGDASPEAIARAHKYVEEMLVAQGGNPDVVAAAGAEALLLGNAAELRPKLQKALAELTSKRPQGAAQVALELAQSFAKDKDLANAKGSFDQADKLGEAHVGTLAEHAEFLAGPGHDPAGASKLFEQAVKESPTHGPAALGLARLQVGPLATPDKAEPVLQALTAAAKDLSTEEQARLHALLGMVRVSQKRTDEAEAEFKQASKLAPKSAAVEQAYASYLLKRALFEQALPLYQDAYNQQPDDLDNLDGLVVAMVGADQAANAEKLVAAGNSKFPNNARVAVLQGLVAVGEGKELEAEADFKTAIQRDPKCTRADLSLARVYLKAEKLKEAHETLDAALKKAPKDPELNTAWGELAMAEGRVEDALGIFQQALALDADSARAHLGRARALLAKNALPEALAEAEQSVKQDDHMPRAHKVLGDVLFAQGEFAKAKEQYQTALKQNGKDDEAYVMLGRSCFSLDDFDGAQTAFENAHTLNRTSYHPYYWLALAHLKKHEITQAIESMNKALDNGGQSDPDVHYQFGLIYKAGDGHYNDALDEFKAALKLKPSYLDVQESLGDALFETNDYKGAQSYYEQAYATDPKRTALLGKVGDCYAKQSQWAKAIDAFNRHLQADPGAVGDYFKIGNAYNELNKKKEAVAAYVKATSKDAKNADAWRALGFAYKETNRNKDAVAAFKQYLKVAPASEKNNDDRKDIEGEIESLGGTVN